MTAAAGLLSVPIDLLADLLSASATFQTAMDESTAAAAKLHIAENEDHTLGDPVDECRNRAIVTRLDFRSTQTSVSDFDTEYEFLVLVEYEVSPDDWLDDPRDVIRIAQNRAGAMIAEMRTAMIDDRHLYPDVVSWDVGDVTGPDPREDSGNHFAMIPLILGVRGVF